MIDYIKEIMVFIGGGGATILVTLPYLKSKAKAEADNIIQQTYRTLIEDLNKERKELKQEVKQLKEDMITMKAKMKQYYCPLSETCKIRLQS